MFLLEILVLQNVERICSRTSIDAYRELVAVDGAAAAAGARRVSALYHEGRDDAVKDGVVVVAAFGELGEVVARLRRVGVVELDGDSTLCRVRNGAAS